MGRNIMKLMAYFQCTRLYVSVAAIVKNKLHRQSATLTEYKQKVLDLQKKLIQVYTCLLYTSDAADE